MELASDLTVDRSPGSPLSEYPMIKAITKPRTLQAVALVSGLAIGCTSSANASDIMVSNTTAMPVSEVVLVSEVEWEKLNPARGDKSPQAG